MSTLIRLISHSVLAGTPLLFGTLGEIVNEKAGHLNLGVEGMMAMGACAGFMAGYLSGSLLLSLLFAFLAGALGALIYALLTVTLMADQNVTGLTLTIFGVGLSNFIGQYMLVNTATNTLKLPEALNNRLKALSIPGLSQLPVAGSLLFSYDLFVYLSIAIALLLGWYINHSHSGRNLRAVGENPAAADAAGIHVTRVKYLNLLLGGGICGLGGAYAAMVSNGGVWLSDTVGGRGWIAVALVIFAAWNPVRAILGAYVFGAFSVLKYYVPKSVLSLPNAFYDALPFIVTALVLVISSILQKRKNAQPASVGLSYYREER
ncbi:ABC transporter permease [Oscillospiraceae bacterium HV4-5-C5C]|nr:ABC transporter permease [Oscillospiraceae bacterium HV4-5-C5C]